MKVISKNRNYITMFENGLWILRGKTIVYSEQEIVFAEYETAEEAREEFEVFMNHACNAVVFEFGKTHK